MAEVLSPEEFAARYGRQEEEDAETLSPEDFAARYNQEPEKNIKNDPYEILKMLNPIPAEITENPKAAAMGLLHAPNAALFGGGPQLYGAARTGSEALVNPQAKELLQKYRQYRDQARGVLDEATNQAPVTSAMAGLGGGMVTGKIPSKIINPAPGMLKGAASGAAIGAGSGMLQSRNDYTTPEGLTSAPADAAGGAVWGALIGAPFGAIRNLFKSKEDVAKLAQAKFNTPRQVLEEYINAGGDRSNKLMAARPRNEVVEDVKEALKQLKTRFYKGSKDSLNVLKDGNKPLDKQEIINILDKEVKSLAAETKGLGFEPRQKVQGVIGYLATLLDSIKKSPNPTIPQPEIKRLLQGLDQQLDGQYSKEVTKLLDKGAIKRVRRGIDDYLKSNNPEYAQVMGTVSNDRAKFEEISKALGGTDNARINSLRSAFTQGQKGIGKQKRQALKDLDQLLGTDLEDKALWSHFSEQFDKSSMNGSMNQKRWAEILKFVPGGNLIAPIMGSIQDQFGRANARVAIEFYIGLQRLMKEDQAGYRKAIASLMKLAQQGNPEAAATIYIINQTNPPREK